MTNESRIVNKQIYIEDRLFAEYSYYAAGSQYGPAPMYHEAYFCPSCGEIWAREFLATHSGVEWTVTPRRCTIHGDGTLLTKTEQRLPNYFLTIFPKKLLAREFLILYNQLIGE